MAVKMMFMEARRRPSIGDWAKKRKKNKIRKLNVIFQGLSFVHLQLKHGVKRVGSTRKAKCLGLTQNDLTWLPKYPFVTTSKCVLYKTEGKIYKIVKKKCLSEGTGTSV